MSKKEIIKLDSNVSSVTVYKDRAQVTRRAGIQLSEGEHILLFNDLPQEIEQNSIQVNGTGKVLLRDVKFRCEHYVEIPDIDMKSLVNKKIELEDSLSEINDKIAEADKERTFVEDIAKKLVRHTKEFHADELNMESWVHLVTFYRKKLNELNEQIRACSHIKRDINNNLSKIKKEISDLGSKESKTRNLVEVTIEMKEAADIVLHLSYIVYGPSWHPVYDLRVSTEDKNMNISYNAIIKQNTSEDWDDVQVKLSTAQAHISGQQPELFPWHIYIQRFNDAVPIAAAPAYKEMDKEARMAGQMFEVEEVLAVVESEQLEIPETTVETGSTSVVFSVGGTNTIKSDNNDYRVTIMIYEFPAKFRYSTVPKHAPYAYLKALVKNSTDYPFLAGETNIFLDNNFVSSAYMDLVVPSEEFWTFLGVDEGMKVEHKMLKKYHKEEGLIGKKTVLVYEYVIKITNNKKSEEEIVIWDQIPISNDQNITVKLIEPNFKENSDSLKKNEHDFFEWFYKLKPGEKIEIPFKFSVEYPRGTNVEGLY